MSFMNETAWVIVNYGSQYAFCGLLLASGMLVYGARRERRVSRVAFLVAAIFFLWVAIFLSVDSGYRAWQNIPNPPEEAFSDTGGPFVALFLGWLPGLVILSILHLLLRRYVKDSSCLTTSPPSPESSDV